MHGLQLEKREGAKISVVQKKSGEKIEFNKDPAAKIQRDSVVGGKFVKDIAIEKSKIEKPENMPRDTPFDLTTTDGILYGVIFRAELNDKIILQVYAPLSIPLSDIDLVWIRKANVPMTLLVSLGIVAITLLFLGIELHYAYEESISH